MFYQNLFIFFVIFVIWLCVLRWQRRKKIRSCEQFKCGIWKAPVIGHAYMMLGNAETKMKAFQEFGREALRNGGVTSTYHWFFGMFYFVIADPVVAELVLKNCLEKDDSMKLFKDVLGDGILVAPVSVWRPRRKVLNPTFSLKNLNHFVEIFRKNSKIMVEKLENEVEMGPFSIYEYASGYSLDSVCETMLGTELGSQKTERHPVMEAVNTCCCLVSHRMCLPWLYNQSIYKLTPQWTMMKENAGRLFSFIGTFISAKLQQYKEKATTKEHTLDDGSQNQGLKTLLQLMIENSNNETLPTEQFLKEETLVVTFAGTDTSSVGFSFIMLMLAAHPEVQEKVYNEISEVLGDMTRPIEAEDLPRLKYMEAVIKETLRLYPPAPLILRKVEKDLVLPNGKTLVAGTGALVNIWATHRNTEYWGHDAELFRPERFLAPLRHPVAFLAFSFGVRNCIGYQYALMSLKTSITSLLRQFRVTSANKQTNRQEPLRVQFDIMMRDVHNFKIQLKSR